ncbi:hypothetical protein CQW23_28222 [Capsicum baccatum]|uniref:Transcription factor CBF/NF-Y/archaeal histone domain-containing protein n=1 Tax=Capsicum baccatum TaxID=33114 RepID=A0A2G2VFW6_CAPBA|nr:hypothetical protein CQW23_28222 [Capsicum baccatum]
MLSGYAKNGTFCDAIDVFEAMPVKNVVSHNAILSLYLGIGDFMSARQVFDEIGERNIACWNTMINGLEFVWDDKEQFDDVARCRSKFPFLVFRESEYGVTDILYAAARSKSYDLCRVLLDFAITPMFLMSLQVVRKLMLEYDTKKGKIHFLKLAMLDGFYILLPLLETWHLEFTHLIWASDNCQKEKRKTINGDDLIWTLATLGFEDYIEPLKVHLIRYREVIAVSPN